VALEVRDLVRGSFLERAPVVPVSPASGRGLDQLRAALAEVGARVPVRPGTGIARLPIDRVFSVKGFGTVVTGTLVAGRIDVEDDLVLVPGERRAKVRGLQAHGRPLAHADAGQRLAVNLGGVDVEDVRRGDTLTRPGAVTETQVLDVAVQVLESARPLRHGARVRLHAGTVELLGRVALSSVEAGGSPVPAPPGGAPAAEIPAGRRAHARLRLEAPLAVTRGDRFILRAYSPPVTIAGGVVLDPAPARGPIRTVSGRARFAAIDIRGGAEEHDRFVEQIVTERGGRGLDQSALVSRAGLAPDDVAATVRRLVASGRVAALGSLLVPPAVLATLSSRLLELVRRYHEQQPLSDGLPREEARSRAFARADAAVFEHVVSALVDAGRLAGRDRLALADRRVPLSDEDRRAMGLVTDAFARAGLTPPEAAGLAASLGLPAATLDRALTLLLRQKVLVRVDSLVFHAAALDRLKADVRALRGTPAGQRLDVGAVKDRYGLSRKFAIPLLEYLDRERVTRRMGDARVVL
jgi:selenocysteine-specific elongation factor